MNFRLIILITLVCGTFFTFSQRPNDYSKFKTGTFIYPDFPDAKIVRKKRKQIEIYNKRSSKVIMKIKWTSNSSYILTVKKLVNDSSCLKIGDVIKVKLTSSNGNTYFYDHSTKKCGNGSGSIKKVD